MILAVCAASSALVRSGLPVRVLRGEIRWAVGFMSTSRDRERHFTHKHHHAAPQEELERCPQHLALSIVRMAHLSDVNVMLHCGTKYDQTLEHDEVNKMNKDITREHARLQYAYEKLTGGNWELQHRVAYEGDYHDLLYSVCVLDLTVRPEDYWTGKAQERVRQMRDREGGAGTVPSDYPEPLIKDYPLRPVDNGSRMPAHRPLYYDPHDGQPTLLTHGRTHPKQHHAAAHTEESQVLPEASSEGRPSALEVVQRLIRLQAALARLVDDHRRQQQQQGAASSNSSWLSVSGALSSIAQLLVGNTAEPAEAPALRARMQRLEDDFRAMTGRAFKWQCEDWCLGPGLEDRNLLHAYLLLVGAVRPEDVMVEGGVAARIRDYSDFQHSRRAFNWESLRRMDVDNKARYERTKHLCNRYDADGQYILATKEEREQAMGAEPVADLGPVHVPVLHGSIAHLTRAAVEAADLLDQTGVDALTRRLRPKLTVVGHAAGDRPTAPCSYYYADKPDGLHETESVPLTSDTDDAGPWDDAHQDTGHVSDARGESQHAHTASTSGGSPLLFDNDAMSPVVVVVVVGDDQEQEAAAGTVDGGWGQWWRGAGQACLEAGVAVGEWAAGLWGGAAAALACMLQWWWGGAKGHDMEEEALLLMA